MCGGTTTKEGEQIHLLAFKIKDTKNGQVRCTETQGNGTMLLNETRKDVFVSGKLLGLAGQANNDLDRVGLNKVMFYNEVA
ncbi:hypothetical protein RhiJN_08918 [Ceratobasidium sp. AG-Ba]|nr:hypothetical protein RhiJN_08918 [Ceratobasidium sp. AG-Ba]QRW09707.1 hypothetical protein RhiLY_08706 [Ceratobasidium sp. AG-Ba]